MKSLTVALVRTMSLLLVTLAAIALVSCSSPPLDDAIHPTAPPEWTPETSPDEARVSELGGGSHEWLRASESYVRCMIDDGWDYRETDSGTIFGFPVGQEDAFAEADALCSIASGQNAIIEGSAPTVESFRAGYAAALALRDCIQAQGVSVAQPPSEQSFIESGGRWSPYLGLDDELTDTLLSECPQQ